MIFVFFLCIVLMTLCDANYLYGSGISVTVCIVLSIDIRRRIDRRACEGSRYLLALPVTQVSSDGCCHRTGVYYGNESHVWSAIEMEE